MPAALSEDGEATLGDLRGTPASDRLQKQQQQGGEEASIAGEAAPSVGGSESARSRRGGGSASTGSGSCASSRATSNASSSSGRPRSAGADQKMSRQLRQEITAMRDMKLAALREGGSQPPTPRDAELPPTTTRRVSLSQLDDAPEVHRGMRPSREDEPLQRLARVVKVEHPPPAPAGRENVPPVPMSAERASLLSFIAGEVRQR